MEKVLEILRWPGAMFFLGTVGFLLFRKQIGSLIDRTKRVGKMGLETFESQPTQPIAEKKGAEEYLRSFDNPLLLEQEQLIAKDLIGRKIDQSADREKVLIRALASTQLALQFETVYGLIWASQVAMLNYLTPHSEGIPSADAARFYDDGKRTFPALYEHYSFEEWLGFMRGWRLITDENSRILITVAGREFLKYIIALGRSGRHYG